MANRTQRRQFTQSAKGFKGSISGEWGHWQEHDIYSRLPLGIAPPLGLKRFFSNDRYSVQIYERHNAEWGTITHLMIRPHDCKPVHNWQHFQRIKNELIGAEAIAVEVYPAESELIDDANLYHLWILPDGFPHPFRLGG